MSTVTPSSQISSTMWRGERATAAGTMTSRPPYRSAPQISHTEKSNENEWNSVHTSWSSK
ncbi:hypothetical protein BE20_22860 [Sorangium cellulosum]|nr:hypothetical protein BE20_22860 [Sorangium cellulosum]